MTKYHFSPITGKMERCTNPENCRYGGTHFDDPNSAEAMDYMDNKVKETINFNKIDYNQILSNINLDHIDKNLRKLETNRIKKHFEIIDRYLQNPINDKDYNTIYQYIKENLNNIQNSNDSKLLVNLSTRLIEYTRDKDNKKLYRSLNRTKLNFNTIDEIKEVRTKKHLDNNYTIEKTPVKNSPIPENKAPIIKELGPKDLNNAIFISDYGNDIQSQIATFSDQIINVLQSQGNDTSKEHLNIIIRNISNFNPQEQSFMDNIKTMFMSKEEKEKQRIENIQLNYSNMVQNINLITDNLSQSKTLLDNQMQIFNNMYDENLKYYNNLNKKIEDGEKLISDARNIELAKMIGDSNGDQMQLQIAKDYENNILDFEKKVNSLKVSKIISLQMAPQIRILQKNNREIARQINDIINTTIPVWKMQTTVALGIKNQQEISNIKNQINDITSNVIMTNSQNIGLDMRDNQPSINLENLMNANNNLISVLNKNLGISQSLQDEQNNIALALSNMEANIKDSLEQKYIEAKQKSES